MRGSLSENGKGRIAHEDEGRLGRSTLLGATPVVLAKSAEAVEK